MKALGFIETRGFVAAAEAADSALKSANVSLVGQKLPGSGLVAVIITGDVAAVKAAVDAAAGSASSIGEVVSAQVIARPHDDLAAILTDDIKSEKPKGKVQARKTAAAKEAPKKADNKPNPGV